ncbi:MAG TPA: hypothetical protein VMV29_03140 [Ktedonobacterales bacterium]|nr:hypothetical protein [Ktedonobacterales bacterium]
MSEKHIYTCDGPSCDHEVRVDRLSDTAYEWLTLSATNGEQPDKHYCSRACLLDDLQRQTMQDMLRTFNIGPLAIDDGQDRNKRASAPRLLSKNG